MKHRFLSITLAALALGICSPVIVHADTDTDASETGYDPIYEKDKVPKRERSAGINAIGVRYDKSQGRLLFLIPDGITGISVILESEMGGIDFGYVSIDCPLWNITLESGSYTIECVSDSGITYAGILNVN